MSVEHVISPVANGLNGTLRIPGDKSISHRAVMLASLANGTTTIEGFLLGDDCLATIDCFKKMGVHIELDGENVTVIGKGYEGLTEPTEILDVGNSGTTIRLMLGILATLPFHTIIVGDDSIATRPMSRVTKPLKEMGALIDGRKHGELAPLAVRGGETRGIHYRSNVASAQVKSAILLCGLRSEGETTVEEPYLSRDHTERMLSAFGVSVRREETRVTVSGGATLTGTHIVVPGDISSAAFFLAAGAIVANSKVTLKNVGMNPTRTGMIDVLKEMNASLDIANERIVNGEPIADLTIETSELRSVEIGGEIIPRLIDEIPIIAFLATQAEGETIIKDAEELKVKETNRIDTVVSELTKLGANIEATEDGMIIRGKTRLKGGRVSSYGDHRIGMMLAIAGLIASNDVTIERTDAIAISYPNFFAHLAELGN